MPCQFLYSPSTPWKIFDIVHHGVVVFGASLEQSDSRVAIIWIPHRIFARARVYHGLVGIYPSLLQRNE